MSTFTYLFTRPWFTISKVCSHLNSDLLVGVWLGVGAGVVGGGCMCFWPTLVRASVSARVLVSADRQQAAVANKFLEKLSLLHHVQRASSMKTFDGMLSAISANENDFVRVCPNVCACVGPCNASTTWTGMR